MSKVSEYKSTVVNTARQLVEDKILIGLGGNISMLVEGEDLVVITPSGMDYMALTDDDICVVDLDRNLVEGEHRPSVETGMHLEVYKCRPDVNAVVHTHQVFPSIFALISEPIPAVFDEQAANLGDRVELVPYALSGSDELLESIGRAVKNLCNAYILQNHGCLLLGTSIDKAVTNAKLLDKVSQAYYLALNTGKPISCLPDKISNLLFTLMKAEQKKEADRKQGVAS